MKYKRFEELPVWQCAMELATRVYMLTRDRFFHQPGDLCDQLRRAALSVSNNIAEGYERGTTAELLSYLYIARGSCGEVRSMLCLVDRLPHAAALRVQVGVVREVAESCSRQLQKWAESMQNSDLKGQRNVNDESLQLRRELRSASAFERQIAELVHEAHPEIFPAPEGGKRADSK